MSESSFFVDLSASTPFAAPSAALRSLWYPEVTSSMVPQLIVLSGLLAAYCLVNVLNVVLRWPRTSVHFVSVRHGVIAWSTSIVHCILLVAFLLAAQGQVWILVRIFRSGGSYAGLQLARGLSWTSLILAALVHVLGVATATGLTNSSTDTFGTGFHSSTALVRRLFSFASIAVPIIFGAICLCPAIAAEVVCARQFNAFREAQDIAREGDLLVASGGNASLSATQWADKVQEIARSSCEHIQRVQYGTLFVALCLVVLADAVFFVLLARKLRKQANILRRSAEHYRTVELRGLAHSCPPSPLKSLQDEGRTTPERSRHVPMLSTSTMKTDITHKSQLSASLSDTLKAPPTYGGKLTLASFTQSRSPTPLAAREDARLEARAVALEQGLANLKAQTAIVLLAALLYTANCGVTVVKGSAIQSDPFWTAFCNLWGLYIYAVVAGPCCLILLLVGLDPTRVSFLGIPCHAVQSTIPSSAPAEDEHDTAQVRYGRPLSHDLPYREGASHPIATIPELRECEEVRREHHAFVHSPLPAHQTGPRPVDNGG